MSACGASEVYDDTCRNTLETTTGRLARLLGTPSTQAKRDTISEWDIARIIVTPLLAALSPPVLLPCQHSQPLSSKGHSSDEAASEGSQDEEATAMLAETDEGKGWPMDGLTLCRGALWQIWGSDVDHAQIKEIRQGDYPLNAGTLMHFDLV